MNDNKPQPMSMGGSKSGSKGGPAQTGEPARERAKEEERLDESIEESFPASDPSSVTRAPRDQRYAVEPPREGADRKTPAQPGPGK